ncbi:uncharacterized protein PRCAT00004507001 [Priceomyces carsonii]|uniref:uncharacterized protein n=1 Tax=Priceomyces carsonii TaxID=28549 RepID=UPI002ED8943D|nr:unnamed protein product [Priceomyces carsonii]
MAGTCITTVKIIGVSSLGLLTASLSYQTVKRTPKLIDELTFKVTTLTNSYISKIKAIVLNTLILNTTLAGIASSLFAMAFKCSPKAEKHPYLIYSAIGSAMTIGSVWFKGYKSGMSLLRRPKIKAVAKAQPISEKPKARDDEEESQLSKSYIHVSDEDSTSTTPSPVSSTPGSPRNQPIADNEAEEAAIEDEVENALTKKEYINDLKEINSSYFVGSIFSGVALFVSVIGLIGDFYF